MKHADRLTDRIFMIDALPNLQDLGMLTMGGDVPEVPNCDLRLQSTAQAMVEDGNAKCVPDSLSRDLPQDILNDTDEHIDFLETQTELAGKVGIHYHL